MPPKVRCAFWPWCQPKFTAHKFGCLDKGIRRNRIVARKVGQITVQFLRSLYLYFYSIYG